MQSMIDGLQKNSPNGQFTLGGTTFTTASLVALFQSVITAMANVTAAQASATDAVAAMNGVVAKAEPVFRSLKSNLLNTNGAATSTLANFGLEPPQARTPQTSAEKTAAVEKAKATRAARGTTSKKQKLKVTGNVTGIIVTPVTAPAAAPSPAVQPAPTTTK
ncbi:MAG TPA: hypothetical protein VGL81_07820 [Polyangiaceae bacterium]